MPGRPAKPMNAPASGECADGALSLDDGAAFLGISKRMLEVIAYDRGELDVIHEGRKPRVLKSQLIARLAAQLEAARGKRVKG